MSLIRLTIILKNIYLVKEKSMQEYVIHGHTYVHKYGQMAVLKEKYYVYNTESHNSVNYVPKNV